LAPANFFTGRTDIPRYLLNGDENCRFAYVVVGQEGANRLAEEFNPGASEDLLNQIRDHIEFIEAARQEEQNEVEALRNESQPNNPPEHQ